MTGLRMSLALILFLGTAVRAAAAGRAPVDERIFAGKGPGEEASFLVVLRDAADLSPAFAIADRAARLRFVFEALSAQAEVSQATVRARLAGLGVAFRPFFLVNMIEVRAPRDVADELALLPEVSSITPNREASMASLPDDRDGGSAALGARESAAVEPNLTLIGAPQVWAKGFTGQGIVVGIADTGFAWEHPALKGHYRGFSAGAGGVAHGYNWHDAVHDAGAGNPCGSNAAAPCDDDGHGTSTSGLSVGGEGENQIGVAPGSTFIGCRNMDRGAGTPARYTECFQWFLAPTDAAGANPRPDLAPHVINNSWGCPVNEGCTDPNVLRAVVDNVAAAGIFLSVSAGNSGPACATASDVPVFYGSVFTVGATTLADEIASFSSRGPAAADGSGRLKPDISAPGVSVRTSAQPSSYRSFSGTSAAAPHVTGAVALLWSASPALVGQVAATASLLERSAVPLRSAQDCGGFPGANVPNAVFGYGRLDIAAAVALAPAAEPRAAPAPRFSRRPAPRVVGPRSQ
ncbi:MAG: S8 family serine peptidase [Acidobacteriota bacterium]